MLKDTLTFWMQHRHNIQGSLKFKFGDCCAPCMMRLEACFMVKQLCNCGILCNLGEVLQ